MREVRWRAGYGDRIEPLIVVGESAKFVTVEHTRLSFFDEKERVEPFGKTYTSKISKFGSEPVLPTWEEAKKALMLRLYLDLHHAEEKVTYIKKRLEKAKALRKPRTKKEE